LKKFILLLVIISFIGCKPEVEIPENFDYGTIVNNTYINEYFQLQIPFDSTWHVNSKAEMKQAMEDGMELIDGGSYKNTLKASEINIANLFAIDEFKPDEIYLYNSSLAIVAENIQNYPNLKRGKDILTASQKLMKTTPLDYKFEFIDAPKRIANLDFDVMMAEAHYMDLDIKQQYFATVTKGFSFAIIISYVTDEQKEKLESIVNHIIPLDARSKKNRK